MGEIPFLILGFLVGGLAGYAHAWHAGYRACQRELEEDFMQSAVRRAREWRRAD